MRILLIGGSGQVGYELQRALAPHGELIAPGRAELDLAQTSTIERALEAHRPDIIVNAAAYTAVDRAETERDLAFTVNAAAPGVIARGAARLGALLVHYSTDYVFSGEKKDPYVENDAPNPLSVYGASKLEGEKAIRASGCRHLIFRTSWIYAPRGKNFLLTVLRLAREKPELRVVDDQFGAPTTALMPARATAAVLARDIHAREMGTYHMSASGRTTWYGFAREIVKAMGYSTAVVPIRTEEYPLPARRPRNSVLDNGKLHRTFHVHLPDWREGLSLTLAELGQDR